VYPHPTFALLRFLQADKLLEGTSVLPRMQAVLAALNYPLTDREHLLSPLEALHELQRQAADIPQIRLKPFLSPGEENSYHVDLTMSYEQVLNQVQRVSVSATAFLGHLKAVHNRMIKLARIFSLWWVSGAEEVMQAVDRASSKTTKQLEVMADDEFSTAMEEKDIEVAAVIEATTLLIGNLKATLKLASETYQLGRDQINISLSDSNIPASGLPGGAPQTQTPSRPPSGSTDSLRQAFGDRVQQTPVQVEEDDLGAALAPELLLQTGPTAEQLETGAVVHVHVPEAESEPVIVLTSTQVAAFQGDLVSAMLADASAQDPAGKELMAAMQIAAHEVAAEPKASPTEAAPPLLARKQGDPLPVNFNISLTAPGITGKHEDVIVSRGKTKLRLIAQADPSENGVYRYMGPDQPLVRIDETKPGKPTPEPLPESPAVATVTKTNPQDPFSTSTVTAPVQPDQPNPPAETDPEPPRGGLDLDDGPDLTGPSEVTPPTTSLEDDEDALLAGVTTVLDLTPARTEEVAVPLLDAPRAPAGSSTAAAVVAAVSIVAQGGLAAPSPSSLFRDRKAAPGVKVIDRPFGPPPTTAPPATTGLEDML
jgi:hypothetical protein